MLLLLLATALGAQETPTDPSTGEPLTGPQRVEGRVVRPGARDMLPVAGIWVTLHRVGTDTAAPLDSTRSDASGRYAFSFRRSGDADAIYFVSAEYSGISYFTQPLAHAVVRGAEAEIAVFDTTSGAVPIRVRGRHLIVSAVDANAIRTVTEVYELANDSSLTRVAPAGRNGSVWSVILPAEAAEFQVPQGDIPASAVSFREGRASVYAPIAPGMKQLVVSYSLPARVFPLSIPLEDGAQVLEVLIEDPSGTVSGARLREVAPVSLERRSFRRFLADDVPPNSVSVIDLPAASRSRSIDSRLTLALMFVLGSGMIVMLARILRRR